MEENLPLHAQKVAILSRLMKENTSLTLEESLLLLKDETEEDNQVVDNQSDTSNYFKYSPVQTNFGYTGTSINSIPFHYGTTTTNTTLTISGNLSETNTDIEHANL